jgi:hypothetical protein
VVPHLRNQFGVLLGDRQMSEVDPGNRTKC